MRAEIFSGVGDWCCIAWAGVLWWASHAHFLFFPGSGADRACWGALSVRADRCGFEGKELTMGILAWLIAGAIGGLAGVVMWAGVSYTTGYEVGWIAWGVGVLVGVGVRLASNGSWGVAPGGVAVLIAVAAVLGGKYTAAQMAVSQFLDHELSEEYFEFDDETTISFIADSIVDRYEREGRHVSWPSAAMTVGVPYLEEHYPPEIWHEASRHWETMTVDQQEDYRRQVQEYEMRRLHNARSAIGAEVFLASFSLFDLLWFALAIGSAYTIGSGMSGEEE